MPLMPKGVGWQIHVPMASRTSGIFVPRKVHVVTLYTGLFPAFAFFMLNVLEVDAETVQVSVDPENFATPGPLNRSCINATALQRLHVEKTKS